MVQKRGQFDTYSFSRINQVAASNFSNSIAIFLVIVLKVAAIVRQLNAMII